MPSRFIQIANDERRYLREGKFMQVFHLGLFAERDDLIAHAGSLLWMPA